MAMRRMTPGAPGLVHGRGSPPAPGSSAVMHDVPGLTPGLVHVGTFPSLHVGPEIV